MIAPRTYVVTGADSGIGAELTARLMAGGDRVISTGLGSTVTVRADLATAEGRHELVRRVGEHAPSGIDGLALVAGIGDSSPLAVRVNYFATTGLAESFRPLLAGRPAPRVVVVSSASSLSAGDSELIEACLIGDEQRAAHRAERLVARGRGSVIYRSTKIALNIWLRRTALARPWIDGRVLLNAVAPGIVDTEVVRASVLSDPARVRVLADALPQALGMPGPVAPVADTIAWFLSPHAGFTTGQVLFVDGGAEVALRGDAPFREGVRYGPVRMTRMVYWSLVAAIRARRKV